MKREVIISLIVFIAVSLAAKLESQEVPTTLNVIYNNVPPMLISQIPNQTWAMNANLTDAFDLDDYFIDNDTLTYNFTSVENISVIINTTTNIISFYPDFNFSGIRNITFTAYDSFTTTNSNLVYLNVTPDTEPPTWNSPSKDVTTIFQNTIINFATVWEDNFNLGKYYFSANQLGSWVDYPNITFSGRQNISTFQLQNSAPGGSTVQWKFVAFDALGNMNETSIQNYTVNQTQSSSSNQTQGSGSNTTQTGTTSERDRSEEDTSQTTEPKTTVQKKSSYIIEPEGPFILEIRQSESGTISFKITNTGNTDLSFNLTFFSLEELSKQLNIYEFNLTAGESKTITAQFTAGEKLTPDIYFGKIKIKTRLEVKEISIAVTVKKFITNLQVAVEIPQEFKNIKTGGKIRANITIENLQDFKTRNITLYYAINSFGGVVINSAHEQFSMTAQKIILNKELEIPPETKIGEYIFFARAVSGEEIALDSDTFTIGEKFNLSSLIKSNLILISIAILSAIIALLMLKRRKNRERMRLLNLYMMITELNKLMKDGKIEEAIDLFVRIKSAYGEPLSKTAIKNRSELKKEMENLSQELNLKIFEKAGTEIKKDPSPEQKKDDKKETEDKKTVGETIKQEEKKDDKKN